MAIDPQVLYSLIGTHLTAFPDLSQTWSRDQMTTWMSKAVALIKQTGDDSDYIDARRVSNLASHSFSTSQPKLLFMVLERNFYALELELPVGQQGAFIPAGNSHDAFAAIGRVAATAQKELLIVDAYMDRQTLETYAITAAETVQINLLSQAGSVKPDLKPAISTWQNQYKKVRPVEGRLAVPKTLHDRIIIVDRRDVWLLTQSLNAFAKHSPATIIRMPDEQIVADKIAHYMSEWNGGKPL